MRSTTTFILCSLVSCCIQASCVELTLRQYFNNADVVFTGKVEDIYYTCNLWLDVANENTAVDRPAIRSCHGGNSVARVTVDQVFKDSWEQIKNSGASNGVLVVSNGSTTGIPLMNDRSYLLFAKSFAGSIYLVGECDGSKFLEIANDELRQLEEIRRAFNGESAP